MFTFHPPAAELRLWPSDVLEDGRDELARARRAQTDLARELDRVLRRGVRSVYQPVVEIASGEVVAFEALARGPVGSVLESPAELFDAARRQGRVAELDRACRDAALRGALEGGLQAPVALFINVEPGAIDAEIDDLEHACRHAAAGRLQVFFEITERALTSRPAGLLDSVERMRSAGFGIALDDVGADRRSLALLPLLRPDIVKLDLSLIHNHPNRRSGEVMNGVCAYAEQSGATIVAEGVETEQHLVAARSLGASLAQGWLFGRPGPLPHGLRVNRSAATLGLSARVVTPSPVQLVHARRGLRVGRKDVLLSVTRALEAQALTLGEHAVVVATFQHGRHFTPATQARYRRLAAQTSLTVAIARGMPDLSALGVRGISLAPGDPLVDEWDVAVLGPHYAGALVARDLGDTGPDRDRQFEFVLTFDRDLVVEVAASLIARTGNDAVTG